MQTITLKPNSRGTLPKKNRRYIGELIKRIRKIVHIPSVDVSCWYIEERNERVAKVNCDQRGTKERFSLELRIFPDGRIRVEGEFWDKWDTILLRTEIPFKMRGFVSLYHELVGWERLKAAAITERTLGVLANVQIRNL